MLTPVYRFPIIKAAISKREDVSEADKKAADKKYGDVPYLDETNHKYPLDSEHIHAAISYWGMPKNRSKYSSDEQTTMTAKLHRFAKKLGVEMADDDDDDEKKAAASFTMVIRASSATDLGSETPEKIVYLPKGHSKLIPHVNGKPEEIEVIVDQETASALQVALEQRLSDTVRPYAAFDHKPGPASFLPKQFEWDDNKGVVLAVDWTKAGKEAVTGRDYSYFSPTFLLNGNRVAGLPKFGEIGSLTNNPAFREIKKIAATADLVRGCHAECPGCGNKWTDDDIGPGDKVNCPECGKKFTVTEKMGNGKKAEASIKESKTRKVVMEINPVLNKLVELQVITAAQAQADDADEAFVIRVIDGMHGALIMSNKANDMLKTENLSLQSKVQMVQAAEADKIIEAAVKDGKIPPKDESTIKFFKEQLVNNMEGTKKVLASLPGNPILMAGGTPWVKVGPDDQRRAATGHTANDIIELQKKAVKVIQAQNPNMDFDTAFNLAREQNPTLFVEA